MKYRIKSKLLTSCLLLTENWNQYQIFNLRIIMEKARESSVPLYMAFQWTPYIVEQMTQWRLWKILKYMDLCVKTVNTLKRLYQQQQAAVRVDSELRYWFEISKGARQGCLVSALSFNCYSEQVMRESADVLFWIGSSRHIHRRHVVSKSVPD